VLHLNLSWCWHFTGSTSAVSRAAAKEGKNQRAISSTVQPARKKKKKILEEISFP